MRVDVVAAHELAPDLVDHWQSIRSQCQIYDSPFFDPRFTLQCARQWSEVRIAIGEDGGRPIVFFPFLARRFGIASPVGARLSDYQAAIAAPECDWSVPELFAGAGIKVFEFDHMLRQQAQFVSYHRHLDGSPYMDVGDGYAAYLRRCNSTSRLRQIPRKRRKLGREVGDLRFEWQTNDPAVLQAVIRWKRQQCQRTGAFDFFAQRRYVELVTAIAAEPNGSFGGVLSAVWAGCRLVAAHLGMRSGPHLHWWFPVYDRDVAHYSPGSIMLAEMAGRAAEMQVERIDLGKGAGPYKDSFKTGETPLAEGRVALSWLADKVSGWQNRSMQVWRRSLHRVRRLAAGPS